MEGNHLLADLDAFLAASEPELIAFRRDLHAHPEPGYAEHRTTRRVASRLAATGLHPVVLPKGTGLLVNIGAGENPDDPERAVVALRADLDALPMADEKEVPYRSSVSDACHACGHDVHTTVLLGAGLFLAAQAEAGLLPGRVRLIFQPAEEVGTGAQDVIMAGGLASVDRIFALHCDPRLSRAWAARTSPGTWDPFPARWPGSARATVTPAPPSSMICTSRPSMSTSARSASGSG